MKLKNLFQPDTQPPGDPFAGGDSGACCGRHAFCRKALSAEAAPPPADYYDDEELDIFAGRRPDSYTESEILLFSEVLHTLHTAEIDGWLSSLHTRGISLPALLINH
jgi:hypothetical protein